MAYKLFINIRYIKGLTTMKKIFLLLTFTIIFTAFVFPQATVKLPDVTAAPNSDVSIPVNVTGFNNIGAISIVINYDPNVLTFQSNPDPLNGFYFIHDSSEIGQVRIGWFSTTPLNVSNGALLHLNFKYLGGNSDLEFVTTNTNEIADITGAGISTTYKNGSIAPFVVSPTGSIGDFVWNDKNGNGIQEPSTETPLENVTVQLFDTSVDPNASGTPKETATTDANGNYEFSGLSAGNYKVKFTVLSGYKISPKQTNYPAAKGGDSDPDPITGLTDEITLTENQNIYGIDAGMYIPAPQTPTGSIGDYVWNDLDSNGVQRDKTLEPPLENVTVKLFDATQDPNGTGTPLNTTQTNSDGEYQFSNLPAGSYKVKFELLNGYVFSPQKFDYPNSKVGDSDADVTTGLTDVITLAENENLYEIDAGMFKPTIPPAVGSIGDFVWDDTNKNGIQDNSELGIKDVVVKLLDASNSDTELQTTTTDAQGKYSFGNLSVGSFKVLFTLPTNYNFSPKNAANSTNETDSDVNTADGKTDVITLNAGDNLTNIDAGLIYNPPLTPTGSIGDYVWNDLDSNGVQRDKTLEPPLENVTVKLFDATQDPNGTGTPLNTTQTNSDGEYQFSNLPAGSYKVKFELLNGYVFSPQKFDYPNSKVGDSDADVTTGLTDVITLAENENLYEIDAGMFKPTIPPAVGSIGDFVWDDTNKNGIQDNSELGIKDVVVKLLDASNSDTELQTTTTDAQGKYSFGNLSVGSFKVLFTLPTNYNFSPKNAANSTNETDSDVNTADGKTDVITLNAGDNLTNIDAGLIYNPPLTPTGSIGDYVWNDTNENGIQDNGEVGLKDVLVKLLDATQNDNEVKSTTTDAQGKYKFENITAGSYKVMVVLPTLFKFSPMDAIGSNNDNNSDFDPTSGKTNSIVLTGGENLTNIDAGMYDPPVVVPTPKPLITVSDGVVISPDSGLTTTYTILCKNEGDGDLMNVAIIDTLPSGYSYISSSGGNTSGETSPGSNVVKFEMGTMPAGLVDSVTLTVRVTNVKSEYMNVAALTGNDSNNKIYMTFDTDINLYDETSGGGDSGLESNGDLAALLLKRQLLIRYGRTTPILATSKANAITSQHSLDEFYPANGPFNSQAVVTTPFDILGISNAISSYAMDYKMNTPTGQRRVAGIFSTITTAPYIYDHTKAVCDRLGGSLVGDLRLIEINGYKFYAAKIRNTKKNQTDYSISFSVYETPSGYQLQNKWTYSEYVSPAGASSIYNFQVWSSTYEGTAELVKSILSKMSSFGTLTYLNASQTNPDVFIKEAYYSHDGTIHLRVINTGSASQISIENKYRISQGDVQTKNNLTFSLQNGENDIVLSPGVISDANLTITSSTGFMDEAFVSGGSFTDISGPNSTVTNFSTVNYPQPITSNYAEGSMLLSGGVSISGNLSDWISVIRSFSASGENIDLSNFSKIKFRAKGTGVLTLIFDLTNTQNYNYFSYSVDLNTSETEYTVNFSELVEITPTQNQFDPSLVRNIGFILYKSKNPNLTDFNFDVSNIVFIPNVITGIEDNNLVPKEFSLSQNYPNPFNPSTKIEFTVAKTENISLIIYNILGQQVKVLVNREVNAGKHVVNFNASGLASGMYIYKLMGNSVNLTKKMILMK